MHPAQSTNPGTITKAKRLTNKIDGPAHPGLIEIFLSLFSRQDGSCDLRVSFVLCAQALKKLTKKVAAAPTKVVAKKAPKNPLLEKRPRNYGVGNDIQPKRDLSRFVKWPEYVRLQRQKAVLKMRLKVPPAVNQFSRVLDKNTGTSFFFDLGFLRDFFFYGDGPDFKPRNCSSS
jgi:hypothetical protein